MKCSNYLNRFCQNIQRYPDMISFMFSLTVVSFQNTLNISFADIENINIVTKNNFVEKPFRFHDAISSKNCLEQTINCRNCSVLLAEDITLNFCSEYIISTIVLRDCRVNKGLVTFRYSSALSIYISLKIGTITKYK